MASIAKALSSPAAQASIRARAASRARAQIKEAASKMRARFQRAAPALRKDLVESYVLPAGVGAVGALALDMVTPKKFGVGAKGDLLKGVVAIGAGVLGRKFVRSPYLHHAAVGAATISLYKLLTRVTNRTSAGTLAGILDASSDNDLAGLPDESEVSGTDEEIAGYEDELGNLYDAEGNALNAIEARSDAEINAVEQEMLNGIIPGRGAPELFRVVN